MSLSSTVKKTALITGAVSGIGSELCRLFAQDGYNLVLVDCDRAALRQLSDELEEKYKIYAKTMVKDLSIGTAPGELFSEVKEEQLYIDVLVNNAAFLYSNNFLDSDLENDVKFINVNVVSLTSLCKLFIRDMINNGGGKILNLTSTAAFSSGPKFPVYYASEAYILHFSQSLSKELKNTGVNVTLLCSGPIEYESLVSVSDRPEGSKLFGKQKTLSASRIAKDGYTALKNGKSIVIPGVQNKLAVFTSRFFPAKLSSKLSLAKK